MAHPVCDQNGHNFQPRYTFVSPSAEQLEEADIKEYEHVSSINETIEALTSKYYIGDVCTCCGETAHPSKPSE